MTTRRQPSDGTSADTVTEWWRNDSFILNVGILACVGALFVLLAVYFGATGRSERVPALVSAGVAEFALAAGFAWWFRRFRVVLTPDEVVSVVGRTSTRVPLADIRGVVVGGRYRRRWSTWLLLDGGQSMRLVAPAFVFLKATKTYGAAGTTYWREVAESPSGRQAVLIHAAAGLDGPVTPLVRDHPVRSLLVRWWSPTGESSSARVLS
jgi:hypothetical protein